MITLRDFMETVDHRITEGSDYGWQCYGPNAYRIDSWDGNQDGHSVSIVFDVQSQTVYETSVYDYTNNRAYRLINPDYKQAHDDEAKEKSVLANQAWDDVNYIDLETEGDFLEKARAIVLGEDYDTRVVIPLDLPDDVAYELMKMAHERDMTFNEFVEEIVRDACKEALADPEAYKAKMAQQQSFSDFFESTQAPINRKAKKKKKAKRRDLGFELMGVIADYEETGVFDEVSFETVKRVCNKLSK